ncbi:2-keto-4-pentenoate hydratase [Kaistia granuli]|uniref:2-keto-4-pentenoate hydratase n=1 Tax=Kaistia granuli TaxID=363259 RepID=UPI0003725400|nr:fumarylacetoacetate hydrolase family protein [Kaistia granuli]
MPLQPLPQFDDAAGRIADARLDRSALALLPDAIRPPDEATAYAVQTRVHQRLSRGRYGRRIGWKIGCTTPVMQTYLGIPNPCGAGLFEGTTHISGATISAADFRQVGIECEIAVRLGRDLDPTGAPFRAEDMAGAVDSVMAAIELVDDRYADWRKTDTPTLIADDFFAAGSVLGAPLTLADAPDLAEVVGVTRINGQEVGRGRGADVLGHPFAALAWLANSLAARGDRLRAGEIVLTGSLVETRWLKPGDKVEISITGLGEVTLTVSE